MTQPRIKHHYFELGIACEPNPVPLIGLATLGHWRCDINGLLLL